MFRGISALNLDAKGRMTIPANHRTLLREQANGQIVVTIDTEDRCLLLFPLPKWQEIENKIAALPSFQPAARRVQRLLIGHATELEVDSHGRVLVPPLLRDYAGVDKIVVLVGQGTKIEIWSESNWEQHRDRWLSVNTEGNGTLPPELLSLSF